MREGRGDDGSDPDADQAKDVRKPNIQPKVREGSVARCDKGDQAERTEGGVATANTNEEE